MDWFIRWSGTGIIWSEWKKYEKHWKRGLLKRIWNCQYHFHQFEWTNTEAEWQTKHQWNFESFHNDNCPISENNISNFLHPDNVSFFCLFFVEIVKVNSEVWISMFMIIVESVIERMPDRFKIYIQFLQLKCYTGYTGCIWVPLSWIGFEMPRRTE